MARPGITYDDVVNAATELKGQGKNPTIENVRGILGTGSIGTINMHLRKWKAAHVQTKQISLKENLPEELVSILKGLWDRVIQSSEERLIKMEENYQKTVNELSQECEKYKNNNQRWQQLYNQWIQEKTQISNEKSTLEEVVQLLQKDISEWNAKNEILLKQQQEKQERIEDLNRLHKQLQENLEHYREAAREQRLLDQENFERQKQEWQAQLKAHQEQIIGLNEKSIQVEQQYKLLDQKHILLEKTYAETLSKYENSCVSLKNIENEYRETAHMSQHWQSEYSQAQLKITSITKDLSDFQIENKISAQKIQLIQEELQDFRAQNKLLSHDKWVISQEKSQLEGQLKQMQILIDAKSIF
jgi:chromosome segregation ATPase